MKTRLITLMLLLPFFAFTQNIGDTIVVPTFNYSQTAGSGIRDTMINFPGQELSFSKIIMMYNMRCKDGLVSPPEPGLTNIGCGEWDYSCNTYITDSSRVDSIISFINSHSISEFSGDYFEYVHSPTHTFYQYEQKNVIVNQIITEEQYSVGDGLLPLDNVLCRLLPIHLKINHQYLLLSHLL